MFQINMDYRLRGNDSWDIIFEDYYNWYY